MAIIAKSAQRPFFAKPVAEQKPAAPPPSAVKAAARPPPPSIRVVEQQVPMRAPPEPEPRLVLPETGALLPSKRAPLASGSPAVSFSSVPSREDEEDALAHAGQIIPPAPPAAPQAPPSPVEPAEWAEAYRSELVRTTPSLAEMESWWSSASLEQEKFVFALRAEALYWRMRSLPSGDPSAPAAEAEFLSLLQNASPEQRLTIELCINLTKALQSLMLATDPASQPAVAQKAQAIYQQILIERPDVRPLLYYRLSRLALQRSYKAGTGDPSPDYVRFVSRLSDPAREAVWAMRAAFFDRILHDGSASSALRASAAEHYSKLVLNRPRLQAQLARYLKVRAALNAFFSAPSEEGGGRWSIVLNQEDETRSILLYELASILLQAERTSQPAAEARPAMSGPKLGGRGKKGGRAASAQGRKASRAQASAARPAPAAAASAFRAGKGGGKRHAGGKKRH